MSKTINIQEILKKHTHEIPGTTGASSGKNYAMCWGPAIRIGYDSAIKEIVETVIDRCAEEAREKRGRYQHYFVDRDSILNVKKLINYE